MTAQDHASATPPVGRPTPMAARDVAAHLALPFVTAFVEAVCFLGLFKTLTAVITAAAILLASEVARDDGDLVTKALVLVTFVVGTVVWLALIRRFSGFRHLRSTLLAGVAVLLVLFMVCGEMLAPLADGQAPETMLLVVLATLAMSLHNALSMRVVQAKTSMVAITATTTNLLVHFVNAFGPDRGRESDNPAERADSRHRLRNYGYVLSAFLLGALGGAIGYAALGFSALLAPIAVLIALAAYSVERA